MYIYMYMYVMYSMLSVYDLVSVNCNSDWTVYLQRSLKTFSRQVL